ncbi:hypothetical protein GLOTRDRAFT_104539 [Gloeophyllum trabeum ATCC 11539]|uniref:Integrase core domain-containing protein n=1 Tax=Gloeophyllum trabeum (strain ATCC 11539 / FP-39264 / Madison 617) TaxID=670483 RepID=S7RQD8_GLOTA|nr:uncharacterized protein GLOTRDRAFT_104539 [Gloeophyllum trabeum ATCC 11539]EPQ56805.1 hypothetical protein GLOTRDRAFT_104539 [Gloeophyllum trabeum ATCC 11539]
MVNTRNGHNNGVRPPDDVLRESLLQYARERLTLPQRIERLKAEHGYHIGKTKLKEIQNKLNIPCIRKPPPRSVATTLVCEKMAEDTYGANGPVAIQRLLGLEGHLIPRDTVWEIMHDNDPQGSQRRYPGARHEHIVRKQLTSPGVFGELNMDGHQKLNSQALNMGPVGFEFYGMRDKFSGAILYLVVVPNSRTAVAIGHVYLDFVEQYCAIPVQVTVDKGSETGDMWAMQQALRQNFAPQLSIEEYPAIVAIKSTHNTVIEGLWRWLRKTFGINLLLLLQGGRAQGVFNPGSAVHINLFNWIFPGLIQKKLDEFVAYWNSHRIRNQKNKLMPSGATPTDMFTRPEAYGGQRLSIPVPLDATTRLCASLSHSREDALRWVEDEFEEAAEAVYAQINSPILTLQTAWVIFQQMSPILTEMFQ